MGGNQSVSPNVLQEIVVLGRKIIDLLERGPSKPCPIDADITIDDDEKSKEFELENEKPVDPAVQQSDKSLLSSTLLSETVTEKEDEIDSQPFAFRISSDNDENLSSLAESGASSNDESMQNDESVEHSMVNVKIKTVEVPKAPERRDESFRTRLVAHLRKIAQDQIKGLDTVTKYNFVFVGSVGVGKSTLINSLRGIFKESDEQFAAVNETECTQQMQSYVHPKYANVVFWDTPGGGTEGRPSKDYFFKQKMYAFDHIIIVCAERIRGLDFTIAHEAQKHNVPYSFVRSKADLDIDSRKKQIRPAKSVTDIKQSLRLAINDDFAIQCQAAKLESDQKIQIVSQEGFDFECEKAQYYAMDEEQFLTYVLDTSLKRRNE